MTRTPRRALMLGVFAASALLFAGCATQFTGGGTLPSELGGNAANFGFTYKVTDTSTGEGLLSGNYTDRDASNDPQAMVKFSFQNSPGDVCFYGAYEWGIPPTYESCNDLIADFCYGDEDCIAFFDGFTGRCIWTYFDYKSTNKANPGNGYGRLFACDSSESGTPQPNSDDFVSVRILYGPYDGYWNIGNLEGGSLNAISTKKK